MLYTVTHRRQLCLALLLGASPAVLNAAPHMPPATSATPVKDEPGAATKTTTADQTAPPDEIIVVGALTDVEIRRKDIELQQANDLNDLFRRVPSVSVGGALGVAQKIYVRGLEDSFLNVTVDGAPQRGTLFHHIGRVAVEPELLKTVDVLAGAGEATNGFGAIGGAIRFRTRDAAELLRPGQQAGALLKAGYFSNKGYKLSGTLYSRLWGDVGVVASYVHTDRENMRDGAGNVLSGTAATQQLGFIKLGGDIGDGHRFSLSYEQRDEKAAFGQRPNWPALASDPLFAARGRRQTAVFNYGYRADSGFGADATAYWTRTRFTQDRSDKWGLFGATIASTGADLRGSYRGGGHDLVIGGEYRHDQVVSQYLGDPAEWRKFAWDPAIGRFEEQGDLFGLYAQDHWRILPELLLSYGVRYDNYAHRQTTYATRRRLDGLSFNAGARLEPVPGLELHASYAQAFRGKEIGDGFTLEKRPGRLSIAPGLKPERVGNGEIGAAYKAGGFSASAVYYSMVIRDVIHDQIGAGKPPQDAIYYENIGRYKADGVELRAGYRHGPFSLDGYFNHYRARLNGHMVEGYEHIGLGNSVGDNWALTFGYQPDSSLALEASITHYDALRDIEVLQRGVELGWVKQTYKVTKPGYTTVDLFGRWQPLGDGWLTLHAGVTNLFDAHYRAHASVADYNAIPGWKGIAGLYEPGRNVRLGVTLRY